jgi:hypothetical protein
MSINAATSETSDFKVEPMQTSPLPLPYPSIAGQATGLCAPGGAAIFPFQSPRECIIGALVGTTPGLKITETQAGTFDVSVEGTRTTRHTVRLEEADWQRLSRGKVEPARLVELAFVFLLERESNTSILPRFNLTDISTYFPEFESVITRTIDDASTSP